MHEVFLGEGRTCLGMPGVWNVVMIRHVCFVLVLCTGATRETQTTTTTFCFATTQGASGGSLELREGRKFQIWYVCGKDIEGIVLASAFSCRLLLISSRVWLLRSYSRGVFSGGGWGAV